MKKILLVALLVGGHLIAQNNASPCKILSKINALIQQEHVQPKPVDDSLSVFIFDNTILTVAITIAIPANAAKPNMGSLKSKPPSIKKLYQI